jgi:hypothetical protein
MEFHATAWAKEIALGNPERNGIANLASGASNHNIDGSAAAHQGGEVTTDGGSISSGRWPRIVLGRTVGSSSGLNGRLNTCSIYGLIKSNDEK